MCQALVGPGSAPGGGTPGGGAGSPDANSAASLPGSARSADGAGAAGSRGDGSATVVPGAFASGPLVAPGGLSALTQLTTPGQALPPVDAGTNPARSGAPTSVPAARLLFGLPFSGSHRTDTPVTLALGALAFWSGYRSYVRRRRRGA
jgi:hypothetical protein